MLFMVKAKHSAETCPISPMRPNPDFLKTLRDQTEKAKVKVIGAYSNAPSHTLWFVLEAQTMEELNTFALPLLQIGEVKTIPVQTIEDSTGFWSRLGLQHPSP